MQIRLDLIYGIVNSDYTLVLNTQQMFVVPVSSGDRQT